MNKQNNMSNLTTTKPNRLNVEKGSTLIGRRYPIYLDNTFRHYYLVEIISPNLSENTVPNLSLKPIITKMPEFFVDMKDLGLLYMTKNKTDEMSKLPSPVEKVNSLLYSTKYRYNVKENGDQFPTVEMKYGDSIQKTLITALRDQIRWRNYRLWGAERYVDVLWTENQVLMIKLVDDGNSIKVTPHELYDIEDVEFNNPLVHINKLNLFEPIVYTGKNRISELNKEIKNIEFASFGKKEIK